MAHLQGPAAAAHYERSGSGFLRQEAAGSLGVTEGQLSHYEPQLVTRALCEATINCSEFIFSADRFEKRCELAKPSVDGGDQF